MRKIITILIAAGLIILGAVFIFSGGDSKQNTDTTKQTNLGTAPDLTFTGYSGQTVAFRDYIGTPMVINSWAAWCPFCKQELIDFVEVQKELGEQVVIIAVNRAESLDTARKFSDQQGITEDLVFLLDPRDSFYQSITGFSMPETIFIDKQGNIVEHKRGPMNAKEIKSKIIPLIQND